MSPLLAQLAAVCPSCSTWTEAGSHRCAGCDADIPVVRWVAGTPTPEPREVAEPRAASASPRSTTDSGSLAVVQPPAPPAPPVLRSNPRTTIRRPGAPGLPGVKCARCGKTHPASVLFCPGCGARLAAMREVAARRHPSPSVIRPGTLRLSLMRGVGTPGTVWPLASERMAIGRNQGDIRFPADETLGPLAATLEHRDGRLFVRDEPGGSGVFVRIRHPEILRDGEHFAIGDQRLRFTGRIEAPSREAGGILRLGSPLPALGPLLRIEQILEGARPGRAWVRRGPVGLGRALGELLFPDDPFVSARHCELDLDSQGAIIRDLGSSNGTFVRVPSGGERELLPGDALRLGRNILRLEPVEEGTPGAGDAR